MKRNDSRSDDYETSTTEQVHITSQVDEDEDERKPPASSSDKKRTREKRRREDMNLAMKALQHTLTNIDSMNSQNVQSVGRSTENNISPNASAAMTGIFHTSSSVASNPVMLSSLPLGQKEVITNAVEALKQIHFENEYHKAQEAHLMDRINAASRHNARLMVS